MAILMMQGADDLLSVCTTEVQSKKNNLGPVVDLKLESDTEAARGEGRKTFFAQKIAGLLKPLNVRMNQKDFFSRCRHELHIFKDLLDDIEKLSRAERLYDPAIGAGFAAFLLHALIGFGRQGNDGHVAI